MASYALLEQRLLVRLSRRVASGSASLDVSAIGHSYCWARRELFKAMVLAFLSKH